MAHVERLVGVLRIDIDGDIREFFVQRAQRACVVKVRVRQEYLLKRQLVFLQRIENRLRHCAGVNKRAGLGRFVIHHIAVGFQRAER